MSSWLPRNPATRLVRYSRWWAAAEDLKRQLASLLRRGQYSDVRGARDGDARQARPSVGSWALYGLGTENQNLPGFIVMCPGGYPIAESQNWQSGFLPGIFQGTYIDTQHTDIERLIEHIRNRSTTRPEQRRQLDLIR